MCKTHTHTHTHACTSSPTTYTHYIYIDIVHMFMSSMCMSVCPSVCLSVRLSVYVFMYVRACACVHGINYTYPGGISLRAPGPGSVALPQRPESPAAGVPRFRVPCRRSQLSRVAKMSHLFLVDWQKKQPSFLFIVCYQLVFPKS